MNAKNPQIRKIHFRVQYSKYPLLVQSVKMSSVATGTAMMIINVAYKDRSFY